MKKYFKESELPQGQHQDYIFPYVPCNLDVYQIRLRKYITNRETGVSRYFEARPVEIKWYEYTAGEPLQEPFLTLPGMQWQDKFVPSLFSYKLQEIEELKKEIKRKEETIELLKNNLIDWRKR
jgi:hypothetical protein